MFRREPCIVGKTARGSLPTTTRPAASTSARVDANAL
jgi:hypothetical protein